jgi:uncharacterized iron-regulated membrane protein
MLTDEDAPARPAESRPQLKKTQGKPKRSAKQSGLYRAVWRWHFYAGLFSIPIIVMLCLTGSVYLLKPQIESLLYGHLMQVTPGAQTVSYTEQLGSVMAAYPKATISSVTPPLSPSGDTEFEVVRKGVDKKLADFALDYSVFVNPYTGRIIGHRDNSKDPVNVAVTLHGTLATQRFLGSSKWGNRLIETVASWAILLLITGIFLWWPRGSRRKSLKGVLVPRLEEARGSRTRWRDFHAIAGVVFSFVALYFLVTGLLWSQISGTNVHKLVNSTFGTAFANSPSSIDVKKIDPSGPWATSALPVPLSHMEDTPHAFASQAGSINWNPKDGAPLDAIVAQGEKLGFPPGSTITMPFDAKGSYMIGNYPDIDSHPEQPSSSERFAFVDQYTAQPLGGVSHNQVGFFGRTMDTAIALHEGRQLGIWNQILSLIAVLALLVVVATSLVMWRKRRPVGLGAPRSVASRRFNLALLGTALLLSLIYPLLGASLVVVLVFESFIVHRVPRLARALGAA